MSTQSLFTCSSAWLMNVEFKYSNQIEKRDNQLVHCHMANTALEMRDRGIPYVYSLHDHHAEYYGKDSGVYHNNLAAIKGSVFSICHSKHIISYFDGTDKLFYLPHGVDTKFFKPANPDIREVKKLLMISKPKCLAASIAYLKPLRSMVLSPAIPLLHIINSFFTSRMSGLAGLKNFVSTPCGR